MKNETPAGLKVIRVLAFLGLFLLVLLGLPSLSVMLQNLVLLAVFVVGLVFYVSLILAINKRNNALFKVTCVSLGLLILTSIVLLVMLKNPNTAIRTLIEFALLVYLWENKNYFSA